jgi:outer membrane cobalamin receptor
MAMWIGACRTGAVAPDATSGRAYHEHLITAAQIEKSGAPDAWEVLKRLSTTTRATETYDGTPERLHPRRGHGSIYLQDDPMVYIDGVPLSDLRVLRQMDASEIASIEELGSVEATAHYGTNSNAGVILIHSKSKPEG